MKIVVRFKRSEYKILDTRTMQYDNRVLDKNYCIDIDQKILHQWAKDKGYIKEQK